MQIPVTTSGRTNPYHPNVRPRLSLFLLAASSAWAQEPSILQNRGEPMRIGYACVEDDLQWAGMSCGENEPCPIYLELGSIAAKGRKILTAGNLHSSSATLTSILLQSDDGGNTWKEQASRIRGSAIEHIQFFDSDHAWAAGEMQYPLPRDPFVLMTADGAASWRERLVGEEGSPGTVQRLAFDSPEHGELVIDAGKTADGGRYISYESNNGGDLWMLRSADDKMPPLRRTSAGPEESAWRIEAGKEGKDYQVEKRVGNEWAAVASFLIYVADCKGEPAKTQEPKP